MHSRIIELEAALSPLLNGPERPTAQDREQLMAVREQIKRLGDDPTITLSDADESDRRYLYLEATRAANKQEDFYESNGNKWA